MPVSNVSFRGITRNQSDLTSNDTDLIEAINVISDNGEIRPINMPVFITGNTTGIIIDTVHNIENSDSSFFIGHNGSSVYIYENSKSHPCEIKQVFLASAPINAIKTLGNTCIISTEKGLDYFKFVGGKNEYVYMGQKPPFPKLEFGLVLDGVETYNVRSNKALLAGSSSFITASELKTNAAEVNQAVSSLISNILQDNKSKTQFLFPFFVRYALRMYDGSYIMHSAPILMLPSTEKMPILINSNLLLSNTTSSVLLIAYALINKLRYKILDIGDSAKWELWKDIIVGIDIFISAPLYNINTSGSNYMDFLNPYLPVQGNILTPSYNPEDIKALFDIDKLDDFGNGYWDKISSDPEGEGGSLAIKSVFQTFLPDGVYNKIDYIFPLPLIKNQGDNVRDCALFYELEKLSIDQLLSEYNDHSTNPKHYKIIEKSDKFYLENLVNKSILPDDYNTHCSISAEILYTYNSRLILGNIRQNIFSGYPLETTIGQHNYADNYDYDLYFHINKGNANYIVKSTGSNLSSTVFGMYIYYPDINARACTIVKKSKETQIPISYYHVPLIPHKGLNAAIYFKGYKLEYEYSIIPEEDADIETNSDTWYYLRNKLYQSNVDNPFVFPVSGINTIGNGDIIGFAANIIEVSQGQFGQYPLYVFSSEGIWALTFDSTGDFTNMVPISKDVCLSNRTILPLSQAVVFATTRGLMAISGSKIQNLSGQMEGPNCNILNKLDADITTGVPVLSNLITTSIEDLTFREYLSKDCFLSYDYVNERIYIFKNPLHSAKRKYCFVYSLKDNTFWKINNGEVFINVITGYPHIYLQRNDGALYYLYNYNQTVINKNQYGVIISRPLKLGTLAYKTIKRVLTRGIFDKNKSYAKIAIFASRNGNKYYRLNSLRGIPFRYFIIVLYTYLSQNETLTCLSIDWESRYENKIR